MADYNIMKAVEHAKLPVKYRKQYPTLKHMQDAGFWLQKKYDGCMGIAHITRKGDYMLSRTGEDYTASCGHILADLRAAADKQGSWDDFVVIGEVWHHTWEFPNISGKFRKGEACPELVFVANDILLPAMNTPMSYVARWADLVRLLKPFREGPCYFARTFGSYVWDQPAEHYAAKWKAEGGFDGAILRDPSKGYTVGLVKGGEIVKVKPCLTLELRVSGIFSAVGEKTGRTVWTIEVQHGQQSSQVGSGLPHILPFGLEVGAIVEIEAMGWTPDGHLREPRFKGVRFDKLQPDM